MAIHIPYVFPRVSKANDRYRAVRNTACHGREACESPNNAYHGSRGRPTRESLAPWLKRSEQLEIQQRSLGQDQTLLNVAKQCHKPPRCLWFIPPIDGDLGAGSLLF